MQRFVVANAFVDLRAMCMCMPCRIMPLRKCTCYGVVK